MIPLRPAQQEMARLTEAGDVLLAAPPGAGKTAAVLTGIRSLIYDHCTHDRVLWVAPKVVVENTVPNEIAEWGFDLTHRVWTSEDFEYRRGEDKKLVPADPAAVRAAVLGDPAQVHLVSKDHFTSLVRVLGTKRWPYKLVVLDESWAFSDRSATRWKAAWALRRAGVRFVLLNGTPYGNGLEKIFYQMALADGGASLGTRVGAFRAAYLEPDKVSKRTGQVYSWRDQAGAIDRLAASCAGRLVSFDDVAGVPDLVVREVSVDIPRAAYDEMAAQCVLELDGGDAVAVNAGVLYNKLAQLASGCVYDEHGNWHEIHDAKLRALRDVIDAAPGPVLIWTQFQPDIERIQRMLPGALVANQVRDLEAQWNAGRIPYLIAHPDSLAAGANLQKCPGASMVWFSVTGNALHWNQGIKRLQRPGRVGAVDCWVLTARGTVEARMLRLRKKRSATEADLLEVLRGL